MSEEVKEEPDPLTALPRGTQESGASGLRMGARAGGKATSGTADGGETRSRHGAGKQHGRKKGGHRGWECEYPWGVEGNSGGREASGVVPDTHGLEWEEGGREASGVEKNPRRVRHNQLVLDVQQIGRASCRERV